MGGYGMPRYYPAHVRQEVGGNNVGDMDDDCPYRPPNPRHHHGCYGMPTYNPDYYIHDSKEVGKIERRLKVNNGGAQAYRKSYWKLWKSGKLRPQPDLEVKEEDKAGNQQLVERVVAAESKPATEKKHFENDDAGNQQQMDDEDAAERKPAIKRKHV